jgi:hypothetical protein
VLEVENKKIKVNCHLIARGTGSVKVKVDGDLDIPDPDPTTGEQIIKKAIGNRTGDDSEQRDS